MQSLALFDFSKKINYKNEEISVNLEKLKEYAEMLEKFISSTKQFISK